MLAITHFIKHTNPLSVLLRMLEITHGQYYEQVIMLFKSSKYFFYIKTEIQRKRKSLIDIPYNLLNPHIQLSVMHYSQTLRNALAYDCV
jgi:hypothetical protein